MSAITDDYQLQLDRLKTRFRGSCGQRTQVIESAYAAALAATSATTRAKALQRLHDEAHKLAGAAGSFGFQPLSEVARQVELRCNNLLIRDIPFSVRDTELIDQLLLSMADALLSSD